MPNTEKSKSISLGCDYYRDHYQVTYYISLKIHVKTLLWLSTQKSVNAKVKAYITLTLLPLPINWA